MNLVVKKDVMTNDWVVKSDFNGSVVGHRDTQEEAIEFAQDYAYYQDHVDEVVVHLPPKKA